jgi:uncharacterized protein (UPF0332 family)
MKQKTADKFLRLYDDFSEDTCWKRAEKSAKHLLSSIAFKECSTKYYKSSDSVLLSPIGYYYSIFHMSMTLCWLNPEIEESKLSKIRHSTLQNFVKSNFVNQGLLSESYTNLMQELKEEREWLNYTFGEYQYDFFENAEEKEKLLNNEFKQSVLLMDDICCLLKPKFDIKQRIKTYIADSKGEDLLQTYLSNSVQDIVTNTIVNIGYSN